MCKSRWISRLVVVVGADKCKVGKVGQLNKKLMFADTSQRAKIRFGLPVRVAVICVSKLQVA